MSEAFLGEIRMFAGNFPPLNWALCNGALVPIRQYTALFSLLGTSFGGNGTTTFALPNLVDKVPLGTGQGPGMTNRVLGATGGETSVTLSSPQMATHTHSPSAFTGTGQTTASPKARCGRATRRGTTSTARLRLTSRWRPSRWARSAAASRTRTARPTWR